MNLIIDVGNSFVKIAVFTGRVLKHKGVLQLEAIVSEIEALRYTFPKIEKAIISSVGNLSKSDIKVISKKINLMVFNADTRLPFNNLYSTPKTLGVDRLALVCAAVNQFKNKNVLVIDAGTCITYDFVTSENNYLGGAISPGINLRYQALHNLTANLPLLSPHMPKAIIGDSTAESIHSGVINGILNEIDGAINSYTLKYSDLTVILTGGDAKFLSKELKSSIFANSNFLLEGLNFILQFNSNE